MTNSARTLTLKTPAKGFNTLLYNRPLKWLAFPDNANSSAVALLFLLRT